MGTQRKRRLPSSNWELTSEKLLEKIAPGQGDDLAGKFQVEGNLPVRNYRGQQPHFFI